MKLALRRKVAFKVVAHSSASVADGSSAHVKGATSCRKGSSCAPVQAPSAPLAGILTGATFEQPADPPPMQPSPRIGAPIA